MLYRLKMRKLIIVDKKDKQIGKEEKLKVHKQGILHRAVTVLLFNSKNEVLITKRSEKKLLWPGYWECSCSTHVYEGESYKKAGERRIKEELGISTSLKYLLKFYYKAKYKDVGYEHEICGLVVGKYDGKINPNPEEIADYKWISLDELKQDIEKNPEKYAPWLKIVFEKFMLLKKSNYT